MSENDKPWVDSKLKKLDRQRKREYNKRKKSDKWVYRLNKAFLEKADQLKQYYYSNMVEDLKTSNPGQWYSKLKRMSSINAAQN